MTNVNGYVCVQCKSKNGTITDSLRKTADWYHITGNNKETPFYVGPFCSQGCLGRFEKMNRFSQFQTLFSNASITNALLALAVRCEKENADKRGVYGMSWRRNTIVPFAWKPQSSDDQPPDGIAFHGGACNRLELHPA